MKERQKFRCNLWKTGSRQIFNYAITSMGIGILFYDSITVGGVILFLQLFYYTRKQIKTGTSKEEKVFRLQFKDALQSVSASLEAGYSVENAWREAGKELLLLYSSDAEIVKEFKSMIQQLNNNTSMEEVLAEFAERRRIEEVESFTDVFITAKRTGGDILHITRSASETIRRRLEAVQEIETLLSGKKYEARFMKYVPSAILLYFRICSPGYVNLFYHSIPGILFMTVILTVNFAAAVWARHIAEIEV